MKLLISQQAKSREGLLQAFLLPHSRTYALKPSYLISSPCHENSNSESSASSSIFSTSCLSSPEPFSGDLSSAPTCIDNLFHSFSSSTSGKHFCKKPYKSSTYLSRDSGLLGNNLHSKRGSNTSTLLIEDNFGRAMSRRCFLNFFTSNARASEDNMASSETFTSSKLPIGGGGGEVIGDITPSGKAVSGKMESLENGGTNLGIENVGIASKMEEEGRVEDPNVESNNIEEVLVRMGEIGNGNERCTYSMYSEEISRFGRSLRSIDINARKRHCLDERFGSFIKRLDKSASSFNQQALCMTILRLASLRCSNNIIKQLNTNLSQLVLDRGSGVFTHKQIASIALGFSLMNFQTPQLQTFIKQETLLLIESFQIDDLMSLYKAFTNWNITHTHLIKTLLVKIQAHSHQLTAQHVTTILSIAAQTKFVWNQLLSVCIGLLCENIGMFDRSLLIKNICSLIRVGYGRPPSVYRLCEELCIRYKGVLTLYEKVSLCECLCDVDYVEKILPSSSLIEDIEVNNDLKRLSIHQKTSLLHYLIIKRLYHYTDIIHTLLTSLLNEGKLVSVHTPDSRINEIFFDLSNDLFHKLYIHLFNNNNYHNNIKEKIIQAENRLQTRVHTSHEHKLLIHNLDILSTHLNTKFVNNHYIYPYHIQLYDQTHKLIIEQDLPFQQFSKKLKIRHLTKLGYKVLHINFWLWRSNRTDEERQKFLTSRLKPFISPQ